MQFLNAIFLWAGFAVLIPPIIHLFNFRRYKTVYFSDVRFLQNLRNITRQRSTIKQILLMVLRMLVIACLVLAFAEPVLTSSADSGKLVKHAPPIIYVDNSFSMQSGEISGLSLENAKTKAVEIADAFPAGTDFLLITNDFSQQHNHLVKSDGIRLFLQELQLSPNVPTIEQVIRKGLQNLSFLDVEPGCHNNVFVISDFQKNICDLSDLKPDSLLSVNLVPITADNVDNIAVDSCEFSAPFRISGSEEEVTAIVHNYSGKPRSGVPIKLYVNGSTKCAATFDINPYERKEVRLKFINTEKNIVRGRVSIQDFPVDYDNDLFFTYTIDSLMRVLVVGDNPDKKYFSALFGKDSNFQLDIVDNADDVDFSQYQAVILNQLNSVSRKLSAKVQGFVSNGGNAVFVPSFSGSIDDYNYLLSSLQCNTITTRDTIRCKVAKINQQSPLLRNAIKSIPENADMPRILQYFNSTSSSYPGEEVVLESDSYKKIMTSNEYRGGKFCVFYTPLSASSGNLVTHRLIVPLLYNAVAISQNYAQQYYSVIGEDNGFSAKLPGYADGSKVLLRSDDGSNEFIPRISGPDSFNNFKIFSEGCVQQSGFYSLLLDGRQINSIAYNYNRRESNLVFANADDIVATLQESGIQQARVIDANKETFQIVAAQDTSAKPVWKIFVVLALVFAAAEIAVARFM